MELKNKGGRKIKGKNPAEKLSFTASSEASKVLKTIRSGSRSEFISHCIVNCPDIAEHYGIKQKFKQK